MSSLMGLYQLRRQGTKNYGLWKTPLALYWEVSCHCIVVKAVKKDKMIPYVSPPPVEEVRVLQFEDTLSEIESRNFSFIYESLLLEGKAGNLSDLMVGIVLAEKPPAWHNIMDGRLRHQIISSEFFQKKKKAKYNAPAKAKQIRTGKGKGVGRHSKGIRYLEVSGKGKGKKPHRKITKPKVTPLITRVTSRSNQLDGLILGI